MKGGPYNILIRPLITEDSMAGTGRAKPGYVFLVDVRANKIDIARARNASSQPLT